MAGKGKDGSQVDNPGEDLDGGPIGGTPASGAPENPDADAAGLEALGYEAEQQTVFAEAGVSDDLLALRDAVEAMLLPASGEFAALSEAPSTNGIVGRRHRPARPRRGRIQLGRPWRTGADHIHRKRNAAGSDNGAAGAKRQEHARFRRSRCSRCRWASSTHIRTARVIVRRPAAFR